MADEVLVSFCVKCYNQEPFIEEALNGAFSQTYRPIEILISDDHSTDRSVGVIRETLQSHNFQCLRNEGFSGYEVDTYQKQNDSCIVKFIRNEVNLQNLGNWQRLCQIAQGKLLIKADGDDVSLPNRTSRVVEVWKNAGPKCGVVFHNAFRVDCMGKMIGDVTLDVFRRQLPLGAVMACVRDCFTSFDGTVGGAVQDDFVYWYRAKLLGLTEIRFDEKLVKYRVGSGESTVGCSYTKSLGESVLRAVRTYDVALGDLEYFQQSLDKDKFEMLRDEIMATRARIYEDSILWHSRRFSERWMSFRKTHRKVVISKTYFIHLLLLLPVGFNRKLLDLLFRIVKR